MNLQTVIGRKNIWKTILIVGLCATFIRLGVWQLNRLSERKEDNIRLAELLDTDPFLLNDALDEDLVAKQDRQIEAIGSFDYEHQFVLLDRPSEFDVMGAKLVAPFVLEGTDQAILVDRGWISQSSAEEENHSQYDEELTSVIGRIQLGQSVPSGMKFIEPEYRWRRISLPIIQEQIPYELLPVYLLQAPIEGDSRETLPYRGEIQYDLSNGPHFGYAVQWFAFTAIFSVGYIGYLKKYG